jgi:hypothetical protein
MTNATAKITIIQPDGTETIEMREPTNRPRLDELQAAVGGLIEAVDANLPVGIIAYANEEGRLVDMAENPKATRRCRWPYMIVGPVIILEGFAADDIDAVDNDDEDGDLTDEDVEIRDDEQYMQEPRWPRP